MNDWQALESGLALEAATLALLDRNPVVYVEIDARRHARFNLGSGRRGWAKPPIGGWTEGICTRPQTEEATMQGNFSTMVTALALAAFQADGQGAIPGGRLHKRVQWGLPDGAY